MWQLATFYVNQLSQYRCGACRYLAEVVDLFSHKVISWSMQPRMTKDIILNALLMSMWRRNPQKQVLVHSEQGSRTQAMSDSLS